MKHGRMSLINIFKSFHNATVDAVHVVFGSSANLATPTSPSAAVFFCFLCNRTRTTWNSRSWLVRRCWIISWNHTAITMCRLFGKSQVNINPLKKKLVSIATLNSRYPITWPWGLRDEAMLTFCETMTRFSIFALRFLSNLISFIY